MNAPVALAIVTAFVILVYFVVPKTRFALNRPNIMRALIFFLMIAYLGWDFYTKEKYLYLVFLAIASMAVVYALRSMKRGDE